MGLKAAVSDFSRKVEGGPSGLLQKPWNLSSLRTVEVTCLGASAIDRKRGICGLKFGFAHGQEVVHLSVTAQIRFVDTNSLRECAYHAPVALEVFAAFRKRAGLRQHFERSLVHCCARRNGEHRHEYCNHRRTQHSAIPRNKPRTRMGSAHQSGAQ